MLCGACADGLSVMLCANECGECSWPFILMLLVFAMLDIASGAVNCPQSYCFCGCSKWVMPT